MGNCEKKGDPLVRDFKTLESVHSTFVVICDQSRSYLGWIIVYVVFYAVPRHRVIFTAKTSLDIMSLCENKSGCIQSWVKLSRHREHHPTLLKK